jgi:hypothetical protein
MAATKAFAPLSDDFKFVYVSGAGANTNPGMFTPAFGKTKGQAELQLLDIANNTSGLKIYSARPAFVDHAAHAEIKEALATRNTPFIEKLLPVLGPALRLMPQRVSPTAELGKVLVDLALSDGAELKGEGVEKGRILENSVLRELFKNSASGRKGSG